MNASTPIQYAPGDGPDPLDDDGNGTGRHYACGAPPEPAPRPHAWEPIPYRPEWLQCAHCGGVLDTDRMTGVGMCRGVRPAACTDF